MDLATKIQLFERMIESDPDLLDSIRTMRKDESSVESKPPTHLLADRTLREAGIPMGNLAAYKAYNQKERGGVHVRVDANDFTGLNKLHSWEKGNEGIKAIGRSILSAIEESVGRKNGRAFRVGGDVFHVHLQSHDHAAKFARALRQKLEAIPPVGGTHNLSVSMGFGTTPEHSEQALKHAKSARRDAQYQDGRSLTHAHSLVPGFEGAIPVENPDLKPLSGT